MLLNIVLWDIFFIFVINNFNAYEVVCYFYSLSIVFGQNVGIGIASPTDRLHVAGNIRFDGTLEPNNNQGNAGEVLTSQGPGSPPIWKSSVPPDVIVMYSGPWMRPD